ncbi:MAG: hypothetical protein R3B90_16110 [Planctomycetaceae bacterium]
MSTEAITSTATIHDATSSQSSETSPPTRHMLFHCWARAENSEAWKRTVLRLLGHIEQFDGIRSVAIVTGEGCESVETVKAEFRGVRVDNWIVRENIPELGEVVTWLDLLETIKSAEGLCWYGHSKATSYEGFDWGPQSWMESMFEVTLSMPHQVDRLILDEGHLFAGPYRKSPGWRDLGSQTEWHYSGTFFWFDVRRVFQRNWARSSNIASVLRHGRRWSRPTVKWRASRGMTPTTESTATVNGLESIITPPISPAGETERLPRSSRVRNRQKLMLNRPAQSSTSSRL